MNNGYNNSNNNVNNGYNNPNNNINNGYNNPNNNMNNGYNNPNNNMNNGYNNSNNNINNGYNNPNNNMNNEYNNQQNNKFKLDSDIVHKAIDFVKKKKVIFIIIAIILILLIIGKNRGTNTSSNNTNLGGSNSSSARADYTCELTKTDSNKTIIFQAYVYFNAGYQLKMKNVVTYNYNNLTDEEYLVVLGKVAPSVCNSYSPQEKCKSNHVELGITTVGWDTVVDRTGNKIVVQGYTLQGQGGSLSGSEKTTVINDLVAEGYKCQ